MSQPSNERPLLGTLLASAPARARSWKALSIAIGIHVVLIAAAILTFKPFEFIGVTEESHPLNIVIVEDDPVAEIPNPFVRAPRIEDLPAAPPARQRDEPQLVLTPGPLAPIVIDNVPPAAAQPADDEPDYGDVSGLGYGKLGSKLVPRIDPRITSATAFPPAEKTGVEAVRERISDRLSAFNDSLYAEAEAERRATDWTVKDANGGRWGISPEGIHIGKITLPPVAFATPAGRRDEANARIRDYNEIERQALYEEARSSFKDRVEAIRQRKERERAEKKKEKQQQPAKPVTESR